MWVIHLHQPAVIWARHVKHLSTSSYSGHVSSIYLLSGLQGLGAEARTRVALTAHTRLPHLSLRYVHTELTDTVSRAPLTQTHCLIYTYAHNTFVCICSWWRRAQKSLKQTFTTFPMVFPLKWWLVFLGFGRCLYVITRTVFSSRMIYRVHV